LADRCTAGRRWRSPGSGVLFSSQQDIDTYISASIAGDFWKTGPMRDEDTRSILRFLFVEALLRKTSDTGQIVEILNFTSSVFFTDEIQCVVPFQDPDTIYFDVYTSLHNLKKSPSKKELSSLKMQLNHFTKDPVVKDNLDGIYKEYLKTCPSVLASIQNCIMSIL